MERRFNNNDFEKLLRDNANQYRMYPSEKVWNGVHTALHTRRKWYSISALALVLITGSIATLFFLNTTADKPVITLANNQFAPTENSQLRISNASAEKDAPKLSQSIQSLRLTRKNTKPISATLIESVPGSDNPVLSGENVKTINNNISVEKFTDNAVIVDKNNILAKQDLPVNPMPINAILEKRNESSLDENAVEMNNSDIEIADATNILSSQNIPVIISKKQSRFSTRLYFTPTISYRKLTENKRPYSYGSFLNSQVIDINNLVHHKPLMGFEFGIEGAYRINDIFSVKTGLQFNINRYDISAYSHPTEIATVAINSGVRSYSLSSLSNYGNLTGANQNWLENFYFQAALPVGVEITLANRKHFSWGISGTLQPTYVIGDRAYLISSDYKNYAKFPDLMRRWNLSSGFETFVSYSTGRIKWHTGPHVRYQHLSSFVSGYPVKENLFAVGLTLGATINKKK